MLRNDSYWGQEIGGTWPCCGKQGWKKKNMLQIENCSSHGQPCAVFPNVTLFFVFATLFYLKHYGCFLTQHPWQSLSHKEPQENCLLFNLPCSAAAAWQK